MKIDLYMWPIDTQAWVLSWGLLNTLRSMGMLNWWGNITKWSDKSKIPLLLSTTADIILFVGFEHFRGKIDLSPYKSNKFVCWTYESLTDPYGAAAWKEQFPNHFMSKNPDFLNGFTRYNDANLEKHFKNIRYIFCADELDCERFNTIGKKTSWLPFGVDETVFSNTVVPVTFGRQGSTSLPPEKQMNPRKVIRQGVKSGRSVSKIKYNIKDRTTRIEQVAQAGVPMGGRDISGLLNRRPAMRNANVGCFIGTKSNVRVALLKRLGLNLVSMQTKRKGSFRDQAIALQQTKDLVKAYCSYPISFNLRSIFSGITPRAVESMACGCLLFQYKCPPNRPKSNGLYKNCVKYEILSNAGLAKVKEQYNYFIQHPREAAEMGRRAREEVLSAHTLKHRIKQMIAAIRRK